MSAGLVRLDRLPEVHGRASEAQLFTLGGGVNGEPTYKRGSVHLVAEAVWPSVSAIYLGSASLPRPAGGPPMFDLAPGGVYRAAPVTRGAGALLPHRFTLT